MLFDRMAAVEIHPDNFIEVVEPFRVEGLKITFSVKRNLKKTSNTATIQIYNLAETTRAKIIEKKRRVVLMAGYRASVGLELVFDGSIMTATHPKEGPNVVTRIEANDGETRLREAHVSVSYAEGAAGDRVLKDLAKAMGLPQKYVPKLKSKKFMQGFVHHGPAKDALEKICRSMGLEYSIQNGGLQILEKGKTDDSSQDGILLTPESGLIGSPERIRQIEDDPQAEKKPEGWRIRCLLQPKLNPGSWVAIRSAEIPRATAFRIESVEHKGDTHGPDWESLIEVADPGVVL